jgi:hypothetical protein
MVSPAQSAVAEKLGPHFFHALYSPKGVSKEADELAFALMAGWEIDKPIKSGDVGWTATYLQDDLGRLISNSLEGPSMRQTLLSAETDILAVGQVQEPEVGFSGLFFGAWETFDFAEKKRVEKRLFKSLFDERKRRGVGTPGVIPDLTPYTLKAIKSVDNGKRDALGAQNWLLNKAVNVLQHSARSWVMRVSDLDKIPWPKHLLNTPGIYVSMGATIETPEESPWGYWTVIIIAVDAEITQQAHWMPPEATRLAQVSP